VSNPQTPSCLLSPFAKGRKRTRGVTPVRKSKNARQRRSTTLSPAVAARNKVSDLLEGRVLPRSKLLLDIASHLHLAGCIEDEKMRQSSRNLSLLTDTSIVFPSEQILCAAPPPRLNAHAELDVLSVFAACPPQSPTMGPASSHHAPPARRRKAKGRYQHHGVSDAPVAFAHADAYAYVYANLARGAQTSPSTVHACDQSRVQQPLIETDGGGDGTQLALELEEVMDQLCGMVEFHHCTAGTTTATLREDYTQNCRFHQQYHAHRDSGELNSSS
jgi:hypothetical protein